MLLDPPADTLERRIAARTGHSMPASLLESQLATLERPGPDEHALRLTCGDEARPDMIIDVIVKHLRRGHNGGS